MATLFPTEVFNGFGPTTARPVDYEPQLGRVAARKSAKLRAGVRESAPRLPGVYGMLGRYGELIYVGKAKLLRARLMSYFRGSRDPKAGRILRHTHTLVWETVPNEFGALVRELELIRRHRPRFNVLGQPGRQRYCFLCVGQRPAPFAYVSRSPSGKDLAVYGPFTSAVRTREAARRLNDFYRLRDCPKSVAIHFADQGELFEQDRTAGCLRFEIGNCSAPCAGECTRSAYGHQTRSLRRYLDGGDDRPLTNLTTEMLKASMAMQFERAAAIRDRLTDLQWLSEKLSWLRNARSENTFVYSIGGADERAVWYLVHRGRVRGACFAAVCPRSAAVAAQLLEEVYGHDPGPGVTPGQVDHVLLVAAWFRKFPQERTHLLTPDAARQTAATQGNPIP